MKRTAALLLAAPALLLTGACGSSDSASARQTATPTAASASATTATITAAVPSATPTTADPALLRRPVYQKINGELDRDLKRAHISEADDESPETDDYCIINRNFMLPAPAHDHTRESLAASLRGQGWHSAVSSGSDETHLTRGGWDMFLGQITGAKGDDGVIHMALSITVNCNKPIA